MRKQVNLLNFILVRKWWENLKVNNEILLGIILNIIIINLSTNLREEIRTIKMRDGTDFKESVEIRRVFAHPGFKFPSLYNDIAVAELGND